MNKKNIITLMLSTVLLTSCTQTPDSVKSNNHKTKNVTEYKTVSTKDAWNDTDEAYKTEYKKFKLPDKSTFSHRDFDELYNAVLTYVNDENNEEWYEKHFPEFEKAMGVSGSGKAEKFEDGKSYGYRNDNYSVTLGTFNIANFLDTKLFAESKSEPFSKRYLLNQNEIPKEKNTSELIKKAEKICRETNLALGYEIESYPAFIQNFGEETVEIYSQTYYKNIGIECVTVHSIDEEYDKDKNGNSVLANYMQNFIVFNNDKLQAYYGTLGFKTVSEKKIENVISFKSACDILEKELSPNMALEFDEVELWYQPKGQQLDTSDENYGLTDKNITLTPKWYFMINDETDDYQYAVSYVTVDCQSGEVHVLLPGNQ